MANELERSKRITFNSEYEESISKDNLDIYDKYERDMEIRELSPKTIYNYKRDLTQWFSYLNKNQFNLSALEAVEEDIEEFIYFCKKNGNNTERLKRRMASLGAFFKFLRKKKFIKENPMEFISRPKKGLPVVVQTYLTKDQVKQIREILERLDITQLTAYVEFSLATMARVTAVSSITWEQIDFDEMIVNEVLEKEDKIVTLYFDERVRDILLKLKEERENEDIKCKYVFISKHKGEYSGVSASTLNEWTKKIGSLINVPTLHCHDWRHSGATLRKNEGMELEMISSLLNHASVDVTKSHYIKTDSSKMAVEFRKFSI